MSSASSAGKCALCNAQAAHWCAGCKNVRYCCKEHQKSHWKVHKNQCQIYKVHEAEGLGRFLIAARDIEPGQMILCEPPLVLGPKPATAPVCLGCYKRLQADNRCNLCGWPVCSSDCAKSSDHATECAILQSKRAPAPITYPYPKDLPCLTFQCIMPLRALAIKSKAPQKYEKMLQLEHHCQARKGSDLERVIQKNVVDFMKKYLDLDYDEEEIHRVCGILDINSFDLRNSEHAVVRGLYPTASLLNHDCKPNTRHVFDKNNNIVILSTVRIPAGQPITTTHTQTLRGTQSRRAHLQSVKHFWCTCTRCQDPTEFGFHVGSLKCTKCSGMMISENPLNIEAKFKCSRCSYSLPGKQISRGNEDLRKELQSLSSPPHKPQQLEDFIRKYSIVLHPTNGHVLDAKHALSQIYGNSPGFTLPELSDELLARKVELCRELLDIADVLEPGLTRIRGQLLYELQAAMVCQGKRHFAKQLITKEGAQELLHDSITKLQEAMNILSVEPDLKDTLHSRMAALLDEIEWD